MNSSQSHSAGAHLPTFSSCRERLREVVQHYPDNTALASLHQAPDLYDVASGKSGVKLHPPSAYLRWTYRELEAASRRLAAALWTRGVAGGSPVFTALPNGIEFMIVLWASSMLGSTLIPLGMRQHADTTELAHMVRTSLKACKRKPATVIALNQDLGSQIESVGSLDAALKMVVEGGTNNRWEPFGDVLRDTSSSTVSSIDRIDLPKNETDSFVYFTSGTTDLPKGIHLHYPHFPSAYVAIHEAMNTDHLSSPQEAYGLVLPNNHVMCLNFLMRALCVGAKVVFPSAGFDANDFIAAVLKEKISHAPLVPTMVTQIVVANRTRPCEMTSLNSIIMGGAGVSPVAVGSCIDELGAAGVEVMYGSTEGVCVGSGFRRPDQLIRNGEVTCGFCSPGSEIKVCAPGSRSPVPRGQAGELHYTSVSLVEGYLGQQSEDLYIADGKTWMATGDQATLHDDDRLYIVGRYKEMIIRGGVNISSTAIEACIARELSHLAHLDLQVVGLDDAVAGEVPVAIAVSSVSPAQAAEIKKVVRNHMGVQYALDDVLCIQDLGFETLPRSSAGKVQKSKLKQMLQARQSRLDADPSKLSSLAKEVREILGRAVGVDPISLSREVKLVSIGDSISMMRFRDRIAKHSGTGLTFEDIIEATTVGDLIDIVRNRCSEPGARAPFHVPKRTTGPSLEDVVHVGGHIDQYRAIKQPVVGSLAPHDLGWDDVRDVFPLYDFTRILSASGRLKRWDFKVAIATNACSIQQLRTALMKTLENNPMQSSFIVMDGNPRRNFLSSHVTVNQREDFLERYMKDCGTVKAVEQLSDMALADQNHPPLPGPLFRASLYYIEDSKSAGMIYNMSHSVTDASFMQIVLEDLDTVLKGGSLTPHVPYQVYCDSLYALRGSSAALDAVRYHTAKLQSLGYHREHLWPPKSLPYVPEDGVSDGYVHRFSAQPLLKLCQANNQITPSVVLKVATMLMVLHKSGHSHAIFSHVDAARDKFPFMPRSIASATGLNAGDVGGQTIQVVVNLACLQGKETVIDLLARMQEEQAVQHQHCAAPWQDIMQRLDQESAALFEEATAHCMFNWLGTISNRNPYETFKVVNAACWRTNVPLVNNAALLSSSNRDGAQIQLHMRGAVFAVEELGDLAKLIERALDWLTDRRNWTAPVSGFKAAFQ